MPDGIRKLNMGKQVSSIILDGCRRSLCRAVVGAVEGGGKMPIHDVCTLAIYRGLSIHDVCTLRAIYRGLSIHDVCTLAIYRGLSVHDACTLAIYRGLSVLFLDSTLVVYVLDLHYTSSM